MRKIPKSILNKSCAIIPAYDEEETIGEIVRRIKKIGITPIVVDDKSNDKTGSIAKKNGAQVIKQKINLGKGEALKAGMDFVFKNLPKMNFFIFIDADMQYIPEEALLILESMIENDSDMVMGYRDWSTVPYRHKMGNFVWRQAFNILFGTSLRDTNCGFMGITKETAKKIYRALKGGYIIENSMLLEAVKEGMNISQVPVKVLYKHQSEVSRGLRMVSGVLLFILYEGFRYRLRKI